MTSTPVEVRGRVSGIGRVDFNPRVFQFGSERTISMFRAAFECLHALILQMRFPERLVKGDNRIRCFFDKWRKA
jgi:hypothetical protein